MIDIAWLLCAFWIVSTNWVEKQWCPDRRTPLSCTRKEEKRGGSSQAGFLDLFATEMFLRHVILTDIFKRLLDSLAAFSDMYGEHNPDLRMKDVVDDIMVSKLPFMQIVWLSNTYIYMVIRCLDISHLFRPAYGSVNEMCFWLVAVIQTARNDLKDGTWSNVRPVFATFKKPKCVLS